MQEEDIIPGNFNQTVDGILATFGEVKCPLSEITLYSSQTTNISVFDIYLIAVSFNMVDFSNQSPIIVYDGNCTRCQVKDGKPHCVDKVIFQSYLYPCMNAVNIRNVMVININKTNITELTEQKKNLRHMMLEIQIVLACDRYKDVAVFNRLKESHSPPM